MKFICEGVWHNRAFTSQRSDWYAVEGKDKHYAFHEWTTFPHFGQVMAAAMLGKPEDAEPNTVYWMQGFSNSKESVFACLKSLGLKPEDFLAYECPYSEGDYFPVARSFEAACEYYEKTRIRFEQNEIFDLQASMTETERPL